MRADLFPRDYFLVLFALVAILASVVVLQFPFPLNHDAAWHFYSATRVLAGDRIGVEIADVNPPMAMWLFSVPGLAVAQVGVPPAAAFRVFTILVALSAATVSIKPMQAMLGERAVPVLLCILAAFLLMPAYDFGQREHLAALLVLPYACLAGLRSQKGTLKAPLLVRIGVLAGIGICFKPYFLAVPAAVELWIMVRRRDWRAPFSADVFAMVGVGIAYLAAVALFAPDYLNRVVPDALQTYSGFERSLLAVFVQTGTVLMIPLMGFLLVLLVNFRLHSVAGAFLAVATGFLLAAVLQQKGWTYQVMPTALYLVAAAIVQALLAARLRLVALLAIVCVCIPPIVLNLKDQLAPDGTSVRVAQLEQVLAEPGVKTVYAFMTSPRDMHPAVLASGKQWADMYGVMMFLPAHVAGLDAGPEDADSARAVAIADTYLEGLLFRFEATPPDILAFDANPFKLGLPTDREFDYLEFLAAYPGFRQLIGRYDEIRPVGRFRLFRHRAGR